MLLVRAEQSARASSVRRILRGLHSWRRVGYFALICAASAGGFPVCPCGMSSTRQGPKRRAGKCPSARVLYYARRRGIGGSRRIGPRCDTLRANKEPDMSERALGFVEEWVSENIQ